MSRFTPGPWKLVNDGDVMGPHGGNSGDGLNCDSDDAWQVAEIGFYPSFVDGELVELGSGVRAANARLIAAAPDLFDALQRVVLDERCDDMAIETRQAISDALAKATGGSDAT